MDLIFASHNKNKVREIRNLLPDGFKLLSLDDIGALDEIPETGRTLETNARIKANYIKDRYGKSCFADDTGLVVDALNGEPGVLSARYAGPHKNSDDNMDLLLERLEGKEDRSARFITVICLILNGKTYIFSGQIAGKIITEKRGEQGFGYDPVFIPNGYNLTFAQMPIEEKNKISHRKRAFRKMLDFLKTQGPPGKVNY